MRNDSYFFLKRFFVPIFLSFFIFIFSTISLTSTAQTPYQVQDLKQISQQVQEFLKTQTIGLPGRIEISFTPLDPNLRLPSCANLSLFFPPGNRAWGKTSVGVRCTSGPSWSIYVQANVAIYGQYLIAANPIAQGQTISQRDVSSQSGDISTLPPGIFTDISQVLGKTAKISLSSGTPLKLEFVKLPLVIRQGQTVRISSAGSGFTVSTEGQSLSDATDGDVVTVRMANGQTITGIANITGQVVIGARQ